MKIIELSDAAKVSIVIEMRLKQYLNLTHLNDCYSANELIETIVKDYLRKNSLTFNDLDSDIVNEVIYNYIDNQGWIKDFDSCTLEDKPFAVYYKDRPYLSDDFYGRNDNTFIDIDNLRLSDKNFQSEMM